MSVFSEDKLPTAFLNEIERITSNIVIVRSSVKNINDCNEWTKEFGMLTNTNWNTRSSKPAAERIVCSKRFVCHHSAYRKIAAETSKRSFSKNSGCSASIRMKVKLSTANTKSADPFVKKGLPAVITIKDEHNHSLNTAEALKCLPATDCKVKFIEYFKDGMGIAKACRHHRGLLKLRDDISEEDMANSRINPTNRAVYHWFAKWRQQKLNLKEIKIYDNPNIGIEVVKHSGDGKCKQLENQKTKQSGDEKAKQSGDEKAKQSGNEKLKLSLDEKAKQLGEEKAEQLGEEKAKQLGDEKAEQLEDQKAKQLEDQKAKQLEDQKAKQLGDEKAKQLENEKAKQLGNLKVKQSGDEKAEQSEEEKAKQSVKLSKKMQENIKDTNNKRQRSRGGIRYTSNRKRWIAEHWILVDKLKSLKDMGPPKNLRANDSSEVIIIKEEIVIEDVCDVDKVTNVRDIFNTPYLLPATEDTNLPLKRLRHLESPSSRQNNESSASTSFSMMNLQQNASEDARSLFSTSNPQQNQPGKAST